MFLPLLRSRSSPRALRPLYSHRKTGWFRSANIIQQVAQLRARHFARKGPQTGVLHVIAVHYEYHYNNDIVFYRMNDDFLSSDEEY